MDWSQITPELVTTWAASLAAAVGTLGVTLQKFGFLTLHKKIDRKKGVVQSPEKKPLCPVTGVLCKDHPIQEKRVEDLERRVSHFDKVLEQILADLNFIKGKLST